MSQLDQPDPTPELVEARISMAAEELAAAEAVDLATASNATLVEGYERLRGALFDMIRIARHCSGN